MFQSLAEGIKTEYEVQEHFRLPEPMTLEDKIKSINNAVSATFVRHPFERLVSAFKDRIIGS